MKASRVLLTTTIAVCLCASTRAWTGSFIYTYQTVFDANADTYIVDRQNVAKYSEWQTQPVTYWGPSANDVNASLTMRFSFAQPTAQITLGANLVVANWLPAGRPDYGYASLWASTDGVSWQLLLNDPTPTGTGPVGSTAIYNQNVPSALVGSTDFWLQARMWNTAAFVSAAPAPYNWTDAQFSRYDPTNPSDNFLLSVVTVPEPTALGFAVLSALAFAHRGLKRCNRRSLRS